MPHVLQIGACHPLQNSTARMENQKAKKTWLMESMLGQNISRLIADLREMMERDVQQFRADRSISTKKFDSSARVKNSHPINQIAVKQSFLLHISQQGRICNGNKDSFYGMNFSIRIMEKKIKSL